MMVTETVALQSKWSKNISESDFESKHAYLRAVGLLWILENRESIYVQSMQTDFSTSPIFFEEEHTEKWLEGCTSFTLENIRTLKSSFSTEYAYLNSKIPNFVTFPEYQLARLQATSRVFNLTIEGEKVACLVPFAD